MQMTNIEQRARATAAADRKEELLAAIRSAPELFGRPRTRAHAGVKFGYQKRRGQVVIPAESATIRRIRDLLPAEQAELLIRVRESVHKPAVYDLTAADLKRLGIEIGNDADEVIAKIAGEDIERMVDALLRDEETEHAAG